MKNQRLWVDGTLQDTDDSSAELARCLREKDGDSDTYAWIDITTDSVDELNELAGALDLHELAVEDAMAAHERQKVSQFDHHALMRVTNVLLDNDGRAELAPLTAFITPNAILTVRHPNFPVTQVAERLDLNKGLAHAGPSYILWAVLDVVVDNVMDTLDSLNDRADDLSEELFNHSSGQPELQQAIFRLRRDTAEVRRQTVPLREMTSSLARRESAFDTSGPLQPYFGDVHDHALHAAEMADSLRDHLSSILETNLALQSNHKDEIMKKVTSWAAIIAVPTLITGFYGQNLSIAGIGTVWGAWLSLSLMVATSAVLWWQFRRRDWL
ncbi:magnesium transporter CorA family protein [Tessaracoccus antarcticus]|uniref:Magnesium transporter n=1 Tax=Tessaracoccus antarcticus TaxID=2479848 RepID=A0A3M0GJG9_9ACTN|nr:magnesium transporter CorA family protein [Tessaracoccus antarcticus]RMB61269.1 magnesium transporter [Tessaracoccus antarcticus]